MNQTQTRSPRKRLLSLLLAVVLMIGLLPISAFATSTSAQANDAEVTGYEYNIMFLDCGRKYFSVNSIKQIIDNASAAGFNYIQLAVGNDGLRFLLDDMSLTVNGTTYSSLQVSDAIHAGNEAYHNFDVDELTQSEMDEIIAYAASKGMGVIPCVNTPGHMDAILSAATSLTGQNCSYSGSARTIDVTNNIAVAFTQALLQKYISYFAGKDCKIFNMGVDEYANDKYTDGSMGFGNLQSTGKYSYYVKYVNTVAGMIKNAGMTPMAFNDGIYFNNNTSSGTFDTDILICYWSNGWNSYTPMPAADLASKGFKLVNTHGDYYWVLGKSNWQCSPEKAKGFNYQTFQGGTINNPGGSMFCIWCDYPGAGTEASVISNTAATIAAFGKALPKVKPVEGTKNVTKTDDTTGVSVTAPGLVGLTVEEAVAPSIDTAANGKVLAYNVTPTTESGKYAEAASVSFKTPSGWDTSRVRGFVVNTDGTVTDGLTGVVENGSFTFTAPHFSVMGIYQLSADAPTETKDINVAVGGTATVPVEGVNLSGTYHTGNESIATVTVTGQNESTKPIYTEATVNYNTLAGNNTSWTKTKYFYKVDGNYHPVYAYYSSGYGFYRYYYGYSTTDSNNNVKQVGSSWNGYTSVTGIYEQTGTEAIPASSTITFTGKSAGDTSVTIGGVKYNIHVTEKAPDNALTGTSINLEYWITNNKVYDGSQTPANQYQKITTSTNGVITDEGVALADLAPNPAKSFFDGTVTVYYWQAMRLDASNQQTDASGDDETADGTTLTHIRYHGGAWQYKTADGVWKYFEKGDQLVAYYLQKTEVTKEIDTYVKDWGYSTGTTHDTSGGKGQVALTVAVVYPDGTVSPTEGEMYSKSTTIFNYWDGRDIGIVAPVNNSDYNISKITVTDGKRTTIPSTKENYWTPTDTITWDKKTQADGETQWYNETEVWNKSSGGTTPMVNGKASEITWSAKNTAKLVLIYLEPIERETNLNVVYWDDNAKSQIYQYQIAMKYTQGDEIPSFKTALKDGAGNVIGGTTNWPGKTSDVDGYLPDDAYVTNSSDVNQNISKALGTGMAGISGVYTSGLYEYVSADISTDGKTLTLHYNLKETEAKTFVVDFGLPLKIPASAFGITDTSTIETVSFEYNKVVHEKDGQYGHGSIDQKNGFVTYTLTKTLDSKVAIPLWVTFKNDAKPAQMLSVNIIPASNVYYEDSLASFTNGSGVASGATWSPDGTATDEQESATQALEELGKRKNIYGYDNAYNSSSTFSMGTAHKVTVTSEMLANWKTDDTTSAWPTASFTFTGTGFDVISLTDNTSGVIQVKVFKANSTDTTPVKNILVNNYYGYTRDGAGNWVVSNSEDPNALYQIPVVKVDGLDYGTYNVTIEVFYSKYFDKTTKSQYSFWLDAIRVYNPMGEGYDYTADNEGYPQYIKLHDKLADTAATSGDEQVLFIDGAEHATIAQYANYVPKNEVYLANGQAISFKLTGNTSEIASIQIGAKAPKGTPTMVVKGSDATTTEKNQELGTATEMCYDVTEQAKNGQLVTITNKSDGILSLTNLKITYRTSGQTVTLSELTAGEQANAVAMVQALFAAPVEAFQPETFQASWGRAVRAGKRATLTVKTSADVESITVDGVTVTSYTTRTERTGWGWWSPKVTYRVFTYTTTAPAQTTDYAVCAVNAEGTASEPITATLTVKPATWWNWWF